MKRYIKANSSISALQDVVMFVYDYAMEYCDTKLVEEILIDNGAQESDEGPDGFLTGVNKQQLISMIAELTHLLSNVVNESESSLIVDMVESQLDDWIDQGQDDVDIDDVIFDIGGDESTIDELRRRGRIDENGHYVYTTVKAAINIDTDLPEFIEENAEYIVDKVNDEDHNQELFGEAFRDRCIEEMKKLCREHGYSDKDIKDYAAHFVSAFYGYGEY